MSDQETKLVTVYHRGQAYQVDAHWLAHRRVMRKIMVYSLLILLVVFMIGPLVYSLRSEEHTSELQSHSFISYAVFCLKKKKIIK